MEIQVRILESESECVYRGQDGRQVGKFDSRDVGEVERGGEKLVALPPWMLVSSYGVES